MATKRNMAVQTIKSLMRRPWGEQEHWADCWYEPLSEEADIQRAVSFVLSDDRVFLNTVGDVKMLPKVLKAASEHTAKPTDEEMEAMAVAQQMENIFIGM
jgi:hypothetical protein